MSKTDTTATMVKKNRRLEYRVVELSTVTDRDIEEAINTTIRDGWTLDGIHFAMREASKRPAMAFILFTKEVNDTDR